MIKTYCENIDNLPFEEPKGDEVIWRYSKNPIINRNPVKGVARIFNSAVLPYNGEFIGVFRGDTNTTVPFLYMGYSKDGINFKFDEKKIEFIKDGKPYDMHYAYDPRLVKIEDTYYICWCDGYDWQPAIGLARTKDFKHFEMLDHPFLPFNRNGVLFPRKINDQYYLLSRPSDPGHTPFGDIYISQSKDLEYWGKHKLLMRKGYDWWEGTKIGAGTPPIETEEGWLMFYHGVTKTCAGLCYSIGAVILDREDPTKVKYRCKGYLLTPEEDYETKGFVDNVCFPCAALCDAKTNRIAIYYGCADTYVSLAFTTVDKVIKYVKEHNEII